MRGERSGRLVLGVYDGGHRGPSFFFLQNNCGFMTNMVSVGDKVFILQFSRFRWRCGTAGKPTASITDEPQTSLAVWPENQQPEHYCLIRDVGLYKHHGRAAAFLAININEQ
ncbi:hypothetical protein TNCV_4872271 [Trichonephila clavipes]|nr:hypothetical protein TNCV_4872271 [Trichonephila clavipes]